LTTDGLENCFGSKTAGNGLASATFEKWAGTLLVVAAWSPGECCGVELDTELELDAGDESRFAPHPIRNRLVKNKPTRNDFVIEVSPSALIGFQF